MFFIILLIILVAMFVVGLIVFFSYDSSANKAIKEYERLIEDVNYINDWNREFNPIDGTFDEYMIFLDRLKVPYDMRKIVVPVRLYCKDAGSNLVTRRIILLHDDLDEDSYWIAFHKFVSQLRKEKRKELDNKVDEILHKVNLTI